MARKRTADELQDSMEPSAQRRKLMSPPAVPEPPRDSTSTSGISTQTALITTAELEVWVKKEIEVWFREDMPAMLAQIQQRLESRSDPKSEADAAEEGQKNQCESEEGDGPGESAMSILHCDCGQPALILTAGQNAKPWNRGRQFAKCVMKECDFWTWCDTGADRQQEFNEATDTRLESEEEDDEENYDREPSPADGYDDGSDLSRYGEDYEDGIGDASKYDVDDHEHTEEDFHEWARGTVLDRRPYTWGRDSYSPTPDEIQAVLDEDYGPIDAEDDYSSFNY